MRLCHSFSVEIVVAKSENKLELGVSFKKYTGWLENVLPTMPMKIKIKIVKVELTWRFLFLL